MVLWPWVVGSVVAGAALRKRPANYGVLTAQRKMDYQNCMNFLKDPEGLRKAADAFDKVGLPIEAESLRKRAKVREMSPEQKAVHKEALKKGLASTNVEAILKLALYFEGLGKTGSARELRDHARTVQNAKSVTAIQPPPATPDATPDVPAPPVAPAEEPSKTETIPAPPPTESASVHQEGASP